MMYQVEVTGLTKEELHYLMDNDPCWMDKLKEEGKLKRVKGYKPYSLDRNVQLVNVYTCSDEDFFEFLNSFIIFPEDKEADKEEESETESET